MRSKIRPIYLFQPEYRKHIYICLPYQNQLNSSKVIQKCKIINGGSRGGLGVSAPSSAMDQCYDTIKWAKIIEGMLDSRLADRPKESS